MPGDEYSAISGGGKLKLKGSKVKDGRIDKTKKKKKKADSEGPTAETRAKSTEAEPEKQEALERQLETVDNKLDAELSDSGEKRVVFKTEAERKHEEQRKKRVCTLHLA